MKYFALKKVSHLRGTDGTVRPQSGINMVDLMMWLVIAALLLSAALQGISYYREATILHQLKNDAMGAASNVTASASQKDGIYDQPIVDTGLTNTEWSEGTLRLGVAGSDSTTYSITTANTEIDKSVVYCSNGGLNVVPNSELAGFSCGDVAVANDSFIAEATGATSGGDTGTVTTPTGTMLAGWGANWSNQLGNGPVGQTTIPAVFTGKTVSHLTSSSIYGGGNWTTNCALVDNNLWCWGNYPPFDPVNMQDSGPLLGKTVTDVNVGGQNGCAIADGSAYCWGDNYGGAFGNGSSGPTRSIVPVPVSTSGVLNGKTLKEIDTNGITACAVDTSNKIYCWGANQNAELGIGTVYQYSDVPVAVNMSGVLNGVTVKKLDMTRQGACVLDTQGRVYCWGASTVTGTYSSSKPYEATPIRVATSGVLSGKTVSDISGSSSYGYCVISDGLKYCWGSQSIYSPLASENTVKQVMSNLPAGTSLTDISDECVRTSSGTAYCMALGSTQYVSPFDGSSSEIAALKSQTASAISSRCVLVNNQPYCSGYGYTGVLPVGVEYQQDTNAVTSPVALSKDGILAGKEMELISSGDSSACGVADGAAYCWGDNYYGQVGNGADTDYENLPVAVSGLSQNVTNISVGMDYACAVANEEAYCWGANYSGQLGTGGYDDSPVPVKVGGVIATKKVKKIDTGYSNTCAITVGNEVYCWGYGSNGLVGNGGTNDATVPTAISTAALAGKSITDVEVGPSNSCVLADGVPYCWGSNSDGQLSSDKQDVLSPQATNMSGAVSGLTFTSLSITDGSFCGVASDTNLYCWGSNKYFTVGHDSYASTYVPVKVGLGSVTSVSSGDNHVCALSSNGVYCWGTNSDGQLGNGSLKPSLTPQRVAGDVLSGKTIKSIGGGGYNTFALYK